MDNILDLLDDKEMLTAVKNFSKFIKKNLQKNRGLVINTLKNIQAKPLSKLMRVDKRSVQRRLSSKTTLKSIKSGRKTNSYLVARSIGKKARKHSLKDAIKSNIQNSGKF